MASFNSLPSWLFPKLNLFFLRSQNFPFEKFFPTGIKTYLLQKVVTFLCKKEQRYELKKKLETLIKVASDDLMQWIILTLIFPVVYTILEVASKEQQLGQICLMQKVMARKRFNQKWGRKRVYQCAEESSFDPMERQMEATLADRWRNAWQMKQTG